MMIYLQYVMFNTNFKQAFICLYWVILGYVDVFQYTYFTWSNTETSHSVWHYRMKMKWNDPVSRVRRHISIYCWQPRIPCGCHVDMEQFTVRCHVITITANVQVSPQNRSVRFKATPKASLAHDNFISPWLASLSYFCAVSFQSFDFMPPQSARLWWRRRRKWSWWWWWWRWWWWIWWIWWRRRRRWRRRWYYYCR